MQKAERGFGSGRIVWIAVLGSLGVALAGCGSNESGSSTAATSTTSTSTTGSNPQTAADSSTSGSSTTSGSTTSGSTTSGSTTTTGSSSTPPTTPVAGTSLTLGWVAPTQNSNGSPITDLAGYKIHYGTTSANYTKVVAVSNPSLSRYVLDSLESGTYFFAITAYNSKGIESTLSGEISATMN
ncbi:MAG: sericin-like [Gammaproteobacteria bacterium]|nr:sericin-like [Gammaproteobacteria bacterium]